MGEPQLPKSREVQLVEFSMQARLRNLLLERDRYSALCKCEGVSERPMFFTAAEVAEIEAEHEAAVRSTIIAQHDPNSPINRIGRMLSTPGAMQEFRTNMQKIKRDWEDTQAAAEAIADAQERQRAATRRPQKRR
jgi:hypothetical protein